MFNSGRAKPSSDHMGGGLGRLGGRARDKRESAFDDTSAFRSPSLSVILRDDCMAHELHLSSVTHLP